MPLYGRLPVMYCAFQEYGGTIEELGEEGMPPKLVTGKDFQNDGERGRTQMYLIRYRDVRPTIYQHGGVLANGMWTALSVSYIGKGLHPNMRNLTASFAAYSFSSVRDLIYNYAQLHRLSLRVYIAPVLERVLKMAWPPSV